MHRLIDRYARKKEGELFAQVIMEERAKMDYEIQGCSVFVDEVLPVQQVDSLVSSVMKSWKWDGRDIGKIEIYRKQNHIYVFSYQKPYMQKFSLNELTDGTVLE